MTVAEFSDILQNPQNFDGSQLEKVKAIVEEFPYFQSARAIYLKGLKDKGSYRYNQELKTTAAYTTDRSVLFDFITSEEFQQNEISKYIKQNFEYLKDIEIHDLEDISVNKSVLIDDALRKHIKATDPTLDPALFQPKQSKPVEEFVELHPKEVEPTPEETLEIGKPLEFDKTEMHSFAEWLKITSFKPIIRDENEAEEKELVTDEKSNKFELIDKFITSNPKMPELDREASTENLAKSLMLNSESLMTETLARIYVEQKNYKKAIM